MTNPTNPLPPYDSDAIAQANSGYFCLPMGRTPAAIEHNQVVVKKEKRGEEGSKQFTLNYTAAAEELKPGFGAAKHFIQRNKDGNEADDGNTNYNFIKNSFVVTCPRWIPKSTVLYHSTSRKSTCLGSYVMLSR